MEDYVLVIEHEVALDLYVERVWKLCVASIAGAWLGPSPANTTGLNYKWDQVQHCLCNTDSFEESSHSVF